MLSEQGFLLTYLHNSFKGNNIERHWRSIIINMCHHYIKVVNGLYMFVHDEKLKLKVCLKTYIECTKNNQTLTWRICKIIICSVLGFSEKNFLVCQHYLGLCWYVVLEYAISYKY